MDMMTVLSNVSRVLVRTTGTRSRWIYSLDGVPCTPQVVSLIVAGRLIRQQNGDLIPNPAFVGVPQQDPLAIVVRDVAAFSQAEKALWLSG